MPSEASAQTASASLLTAAQQLREETRKLRERGGVEEDLTKWAVLFPLCLDGAMFSFGAC